jgi:serine protease SohB
MDTVFETLAFAVKALVASGLVVFTFAFVFALSRRGRGGGERLDVQRLDDRFDRLADALRSVAWEPKTARKFQRQRDQARRRRRGARPNVYVVDFEGDLLASAVKTLREEVSAILAVATSEDEVVVRLESAGGAVPHYGLAAAQLSRLRERKVKLTVCIDRVAASGGYMMASVADTVVAAPFAIIGSIGVVAQMPNLHRLLQKHDVDYEELTAGEFKRTLSVLAEPTEKGRLKFQDQLEETHRLFKDFVRQHRKALDINQVATGEYWLALRARELGLVDRLGTSDDYLLERAGVASILAVRFKPPRDWRTSVSRTAAAAADRAMVAVLDRLRRLELA